MATAWVITTSEETAPVDETGKLELTFTVTNPSPVQDRVVLDVVPGPGASAAWFTIDEPQRLVQGGASATYVVTGAIPADVVPGTFSVQGRAYSADSAPEESSAVSNRVAFEKKTPQVEKPNKPLWLIPVAIAALVLIAVLVFFLTRDKGDKSVAVPTLTSMTQEEASAALEKVKLKLGSVTRRQTPGSARVVLEQSAQDPATLKEGSSVDVVIAVDLKAPTVIEPNNVAFTQPKNPVEMRWSQVEDAAGYRVNVTGFFNCTDIVIGPLQPASPIVTTTTVPAFPTTTFKFGLDPEILLPFDPDRFKILIPTCESFVLAAEPDTVFPTASGQVTLSFQGHVDPPAQWSVAPIDDEGNAGPTSDIGRFTAKS